MSQAQHPSLSLSPTPPNDQLSRSASTSLPKDNTLQGDNASSKDNNTLPKDRPCPFCNQPFTSSSLGRHLDLYIREKNPKPPDGVHNVDEIRGMRGKITRRAPKGVGGMGRSSNGAGVKRKADEVDEENGSGEMGDDSAMSGGSFGGHSTGTTSAATKNAQSAPTPIQAQNRSVSGQSNGTSQQQTNNSNGYQSFTNMHNTHTFGPRMDWQATGVITELPNTVRSPPGSTPRNVPAPESAPSQTYQNPVRSTTLPDTHAPLHDAPPSRPTDNGAVATAALRDVLHSLQRAHTRITAPAPFTFDPLSLNYPALCLRLLAPPASLFSATPLEPATDPAHYWPLRDPPSAAHKQRMMQNIRVRLKMHTSLCPPAELRFAHTRQEVEAGVVAAAERQIDRLGAHVDAALSQWESYDQPVRDEIWRLELLRYCAAQHDDMQGVERKLERTQDFVEELRAELARLREANARLAASTNTQRPGFSADGSAPRPALGPVVDSSISRELEEMWALSALSESDNGGWMAGAGAEKWEFESIMRRYRVLLERGKGSGTLWPGDTWRSVHRDRGPGEPDPWAVDKLGGGGDAGQAQVGAQANMQGSMEGTQAARFGDGTWGRLVDAPVVDYSGVDLRAGGDQIERYS